MGPFKKRVIELLTSINDNLTKISSSVNPKLSDEEYNSIVSPLKTDPTISNVISNSVNSNIVNIYDAITNQIKVEELIETKEPKKSLVLENKEYELYGLVIDNSIDLDIYCIIKDVANKFLPRRYKINNKDMISLLVAKYNLCKTKCGIITTSDFEPFPDFLGAFITKEPFCKGTISIKKNGSISSIRDFKTIPNKVICSAVKEETDLNTDSFYPKYIQTLTEAQNEFIYKLKPKANLFKISKYNDCFTKDHNLVSLGYKPETMFSKNSNNNLNKRIVARVLECGIANLNIDNYYWENNPKELGKNYDFYYTAGNKEVIKVDYKSTIDSGEFCPTQSMNLGLPIFADKLNHLVDMYFFYSVWDDDEDFYFIHRGWCHKPRINFLIEKFRNDDSYDKFGIEHIFYFEDRGFYKIICNAGLLNL